jgi:hypothetical protein
MLPYLIPISETEFDCLYFLPEGNEMHVEAALYKEPSPKVGGNHMGDKYHVLLFKDGEKGFTHFDTFETIFSCPLTYMSNLIPLGWFGIFAKKTETSDEFFNEVVEKLKEGLTEEE